MINPSETDLKYKFRKDAFVHRNLISCPIVLKFCTEHGSTTAVPGAKSQSDWTIRADFMGERNFARFEFKISFGRIRHIASPP